MNFHIGLFENTKLYFNQSSHILATKVSILCENLIKIGKAQGLSFCDETLPNLTKGKTLTLKGKREEQKERTNVPPIVSTKAQWGYFGKNPNVLNLSMVKSDKQNVH